MAQRPPFRLRVLSAPLQKPRVVSIVYSWQDFLLRSW